MNLKLLLLGLMLCINLTNAQDTLLEKDNFDSIQKWTEVGTKASGLLNDDTLKAANAVLDSVGKAIPYAGPLAVTVFRLLGVKSEYGQVKEKVENMNKKLDQLDNRLNEVLNKIETVQIISGYKAKIEQVRNLKLAYERFTGNPTDETRDDFKSECASAKMIMFASWLESEVNTESLLPLRKVMLDNFDMRNFNYWSNQIAALLSNAIFLHSTCLGVSGYSETIIHETLYGKNGGGTGDIEIIKKVLRSVKKGLNQGVKYIKRAFFSYARQEVNDFMAKHSDLGHQESCDKLYQMLSKKYYWRLWGVVSFKGYLFFPNDYKELIAANGWFWDGKRTLVVASVLPDKSNTVYKKLEHDIEQCRNASKINSFSLSDVQKVYDILKLCNITTRGVVIVNVQLYKNISAEFSGFYQRGIYKPNYFSKIDAHVIAIPYDASATITDGEVCSATGYSCSRDQHCCPKREETNEYFCCPDTVSCAESGCDTSLVPKAEQSLSGISYPARVIICLFLLFVGLAYMYCVFAKLTRKATNNQYSLIY